MKNRLLRFHLLLAVWVGFLLVGAALPQARAQGFLTTFSDTAKQWSTVYFKPLPDGGYRLLTLHFHPLADVYYYVGTLDLNPDGQVVAWDSSGAGASINSICQRLPDGDMAVMDGPVGGWELQVEDVNQDGLGGWAYSFQPFVFQNQNIWEQNAASEILLLRLQDLPAPSDSQLVRLFKFGTQGQVLWTLDETVPDSSNIYNAALLPTADGGCGYISEIINGAPLLRKVSDTGQWQWSIAANVKAAGTRLGENTAGELYAAGRGLVNISVSEALLTKYTASGALVWTKTLNQLFQRDQVIVQKLIVSTDGGVLLIGTEAHTGQDAQHFFARFDGAGNLLWKHHYGLIYDNIYLVGGRATADSGFILAGSAYAPWGDYVHNFILKIAPDGNIYPGALTGRVALDDNGNCLVDSAETPWANRAVQLVNPAGFNAYTTTDSSGQYTFQNVPGGAYQLFVPLPAPLWESCVDTVNLSIPDTGYIELIQDFPLEIVAYCPLMTVDLGTPVLRPCFETTYSVQYCNEGTAAADSAVVLVTLDPLLELSGASIPVTQVGGELRFELGAVDVGFCGSFTFTVQVSCDAQLGQTLCAGATISPDSICNPPAAWSGALLQASGRCDGDSVRFEVRNIGEGATSPGLDFIVVDDHVIMVQQPLPPLAPQAVFELAVPADGSTWRFIADQEPLAPGAEMPSIGVEGCGPGIPSWGFLLQFPNADGNPFSDRDCQEVVGSYDPNDKQAFPIGVHADHFIEANTPIDYQIRFQNTGTDTAFTVVIRDTLAAWLDPATVRIGPASHAFTWSLNGAGILTVRFDHILLPDSNANEVASHGFVHFGIDQRAGNPLGAVISNRAGIYFDFNEPVITNTVFHTLGEDFLTSGTSGPTPIARLAVWPNPASEIATLGLDASWAKDVRRLILRDVMGRIVQEQRVPTGPILEIRRAGLPAGLYFLELSGNRGTIASGKLVFGL